MTQANSNTIAIGTIVNPTKLTISEATVTGYASGWYSCEYRNEGSDDLHELKARGKDLEIISGPITDKPNIPKIRCTECGHEWELMTKVENVKCPECGAWNVVRIHANLEHYYRGLGTTAGGNATLDIGDGVADRLRGLSINDLLADAGKHIAKLVGENGEVVYSKAMRKAFKAGGYKLDMADDITEYLGTKYASRNNGMIRMNVGNIIRAMEKRAEELKATNLNEEE